MNVFSKLGPVTLHWVVINKRKLNEKELSMSFKAKIVPSRYGQAVRFYRRNNPSSYVSLSSNQHFPIGKKIDFNKINILTLCRNYEVDKEDKECIYRIEIDN